MEWEPPVSLPRFRDEEMKQKKAAYTDKYGYYVSFPKIRDIIHVKRHEEPDDPEFDRYKTRARAQWLISKYPTSPSVPKWRRQARTAMGDLRFEEIDQMIIDKRRRYYQMQGSPVPTIKANHVSILTFLDDINDTLGTAALVARFAAKLAPRALARFFLGPAGWLLLAAEIVGLIYHMMKKWYLSPAFCIMGKRMFGKYGNMNPFTKKAKARRARKLRRLTPSKGEIIEGLQVTDSMFGIGLCLGPIFGFLLDVQYGFVRSVIGEKVTWFRTPPPMQRYEKQSFAAIRNAQIAAHINPILTEQEQVGMYWALFSAAQVVKAYHDEFDLLDCIPFLQGLEIEAPTPKHPTTLHVLEEAGWNGRDGIGWPGADQRWMDPLKLWDLNAAPGGQKLMDFAKRNRNNYPMVFGVQAAADFAKLMFLMASDPGTVEEEWEEHHQGWADFMEGGCYLVNPRPAFRWGSFRYQVCRHEIGNYLVNVYCSDLRPRPILQWGADKGMILKSRDCNIYFGVGWCTGEANNHVFLISPVEYVHEKHAHLPDT